MVHYIHTQPGTLMRVIFGSIIALNVCLAVFLGQTSSESLFAFSAVSIAMVMVLMLFHSLTVSVSKDFIRLRFGIGLIRKKFAVADVQNARVVRNRWWYGWGIRITGQGWLYNVSGLDAVEIQLKSGTKSRIGSDQADRLLAAIQAAITIR